MAKTKADWLKEAKELGLKVTDKDKIADIKAAIEALKLDKHDKAAHSKAEEAKTDVAKAGKRSRKAQEEAEVKAEKEARKAEDKETPAETKKGPAPKTRTRLERRGRKYRDAAAKYDRSKTYELSEAMKLVCDTSVVKFDASVELHVRLNVDPKQADQNIRDTVDLPHGTGKKLVVAVFGPEDQHEAAKKAGADMVGEKDFLAKLDKGQIDFDVLISTPQLMGQLGKYAKTLGPKGLMPNPKSGTVTNNVADAVKSAKAGRVEFRVDPQGIVHTAIGKVSFGAEKLTQNAEVLLASVKSAKPASVKSAYIESVYATSSMGPSVRIAV